MVSRGEGSGDSEGAHVTLVSDTLKPNGHTGTDTRPGLWLHNKPMDLSVNVSEECGHEEGGGVYTTCCQILKSGVVRYTTTKWSLRNSHETWGLVV